MMLALERDGDVRVFPQRRQCGVETRFPARVIPPFLLAPGHELGIKTHRDIVDKEAIVDAGGIDRLGRTGHDHVERLAPAERDAEILREMVVGTDRNHAEDRVAVHKRLDDRVDRPIATSGDEETDTLVHPFAYQL